MAIHGSERAMRSPESANAEEEGKKNLESYIRNHSVQKAPKEFVRKFFEKRDVKFKDLETGAYAIDDVSADQSGRFRIIYLDSQKNLLGLEIDIKKFKEVEGLHRIQSHLRESGLKEKDWKFQNHLWDCQMLYNEKVAEEGKK